MLCSATYKKAIIISDIVSASFIKSARSDADALPQLFGPHAEGEERIVRRRSAPDRYLCG